VRSALLQRAARRAGQQVGLVDWTLGSCRPAADRLDAWAAHGGVRSSAEAKPTPAAAAGSTRPKFAARICRRHAPRTMARALTGAGWPPFLSGMGLAQRPCEAAHEHNTARQGRRHA
jgi:hypothetical protein